MNLLQLLFLGEDADAEKVILSLDEINMLHKFVCNVLVVMSHDC